MERGVATVVEAETVAPAVGLSALEALAARVVREASVARVVTAATVPPQTKQAAQAALAATADQEPPVEQAGLAVMRVWAESCSCSTTITSVAQVEPAVTVAAPELRETAAQAETATRPPRSAAAAVPEVMPARWVPEASGVRPVRVQVRMSAPAGSVVRLLRRVGMAEMVVLGLVPRQRARRERPVAPEVRADPLVMAATVAPGVLVASPVMVVPVAWVVQAARCRATGATVVPVALLGQRLRRPLVVKVVQVHRVVTRAFLATAATVVRVVLAPPG